MLVRSVLSLSLAVICGVSTVATAAPAFTREAVLNNLLANDEAQIASLKERMAKTIALQQVFVAEPVKGATSGLTAAIVGAAAAAGIPATSAVSIATLNGIGALLQAGTPVDPYYSVAGIDPLAAKYLKIGNLSRKMWKGSLKIAGVVVIPCTVVAVGGGLYALGTEAIIGSLQIQIQDIQNQLTAREEALRLIKAQQK